MKNRLTEYVFQSGEVLLTIVANDEDDAWERARTSPLRAFASGDIELVDAFPYDAND